MREIPSRLQVAKRDTLSMQQIKVGKFHTRSRVIECLIVGKLVEENPDDALVRAAARKCR